MSVYELHIRDFSASDSTVPERLRGKYLAFSTKATGVLTDGQSHLKQLSECGLTHVHLLPSCDFGSVPELAAQQLRPKVDLTHFAPGEPSSALPWGVLETLSLLFANFGRNSE
jgi:pullulanase/glycogen debranching enzyme